MNPSVPRLAGEARLKNDNWKAIEPAEAKAHSLYGVKNWLVVFALGVLLGLLRDLGSLGGESLKAGMSLGAFLSIEHPAIAFLRIVLGADATVVVIIYWLLFTKHPRFRVVASILLLGVCPGLAIIAVLNPFDGVVDVLAVSLTSWAISCAVWVTYLNRSRRVRVTFEHLVRTDEACYATSECGPPSLASASTQVRRTAQSPESYRRGRSRAEPTSPTEEHWSLALAEVDGPSRRSGLWAKCFAEAGGNEARAKAAYLAERADELLSLGQRVQCPQDQVLAGSQSKAHRASSSAPNSRIHALLDRIRLDDGAAFDSCVLLIRLLGGTAEWKAGSLGSSWRVSFQGRAYEFSSDNGLSTWTIAEVVPAASAEMRAARLSYPVDGSAATRGGVSSDA